MKRPPTKTMLIGHPAVATPFLLAGGVTVYAGYEGSNVFVGLIGLVMIGTVRTAQDQASAYKAWKREWDAMAPEVPRERKAVSVWTWIALVITGTCCVAWLGGASLHDIAWGAVLSAGGIWLTAFLWAAILWIRRRRQRPAASFAVTVVARPVMAIPSLDEAYRALPPYCHALLRARP